MITQVDMVGHGKASCHRYKTTVQRKKKKVAYQTGRKDNVAFDGLTGQLHLCIKSSITNHSGRVPDLTARLIQPVDCPDNRTYFVCVVYFHRGKVERIM